MQDQATQRLLKEYFGYDGFRRGQEEVIGSILSGRDALAVMPTGAGKSICYQLPSLVLQGTTIVISPLISLMKDQVDALSQSGIPAAYINSSLSRGQFEAVSARARAGRYRLVYVAPERLESPAFMELAQKLDISLVAVDEAHCVSRWGHDFRPSYVKIKDMVSRLPVRPVVAAFTATATPRIKEDITELLELRDPFTVTTGFDRPNLYFEVEKPRDKFSRLCEYIKGQKETSGIIYASTRKTVENVFERLNRAGIRTAMYHAGMPEPERMKNQEDFIYDRVNIMVATNAFGMGIDKSNISYVIHYNMPKDLESYYQEAGRAGRDGSRAECILYFSASDIVMCRFLIENGGGDSDEQYRKLNSMVDYCNTEQCLRAYILDYFGEKPQKDSCGNCGNCLNSRESTDITVEAQKILSCIKRMGERFGTGVITDVLRGANTAKIRDLGFERLSTYGIMRDYTKDTIRELLSFLTADGFLEIDGGKYPVLKLGKSAYSVLKSGQKVHAKRVMAAGGRNGNEDLQSSELFGLLRALRSEIADEEQIPPFLVFSDASLRDMARRCPVDDGAFLRITGVGESKLNRYGKRFTAAISAFAQQNGLTMFRAGEMEPRRTGDGRTGVTTRKETYSLYQSGLAPDEIAQRRGLTVSTILGHLLECMQDGMEVDERAFGAGQYEQAILDAYKSCGNGRLKPVKERLPTEVSYEMIKFVLIKNGFWHGVAK